ncbi:hypothetical protein ACTFIR_005798 [Dictyostelium discoideum]
MSNNNSINIFNNNGNFDKELILTHNELFNLLKNDSSDEKLIIEKALKLFSNYFNNNHSNNPFHFEVLIESLNNKLNKFDYINLLVSIFSSNGEINFNFKVYIVNKLFQFLNNNNNNISLSTIDFSPIKKFSSNFKRDIVLVRKINCIEKYFKDNQDIINNEDDKAFDDQFLSSNLVFQNYCKSIDDLFSLDYLDMDKDFIKLINDLEKNEIKLKPLLSYLNHFERSTLEFINLDLQYILFNYSNNNNNNYNSNLNKFKFYLYCLNKEIS